MLNIKPLFSRAPAVCHRYVALWFIGLDTNGHHMQCNLHFSEAGDSQSRLGLCDKTKDISVDLSLSMRVAEMRGSQKHWWTLCHRPCMLTMLYPRRPERAPRVKTCSPSSWTEDSTDTKLNLCLAKYLFCSAISCRTWKKEH
jgi:hypothetical protein